MHKNILQYIFLFLLSIILTACNQSKIQDSSLKIENKSSSTNEYDFDSSLSSFYNKPSIDFSLSSTASNRTFEPSTVELTTHTSTLDTPRTDSATPTPAPATPTPAPATPTPAPATPTPAPATPTPAPATPTPAPATPTPAPATPTPAPATPTPTPIYNIQSPDGRTGNQLNTPYMKNGILLINKQHWVNEHYTPLSADKNKWGLQAEAWNTWKEMERDAAALGLTLRFVSGYRTYEYQEWLFNDYASRDPVNANRYSARAGQSEHQSGLALDIDNGIGKTGLTEAFAQTQEGKWLWENAYKYGWILRYPHGKEHITGYIFEPWHYRYVGKNLASYFGPNSTLTLEEYLDELPSKYK